MKKNLNRCKVITHMYTSIDGKIDGLYMDESGCDVSGKYYDNIIWGLGDSMASGRVTNVMYHANEKVDFSKYLIQDITYEDNVILNKDGHYHFCFDRSGKSNWSSNRFTYGGKTMQNVSILSKQVSKQYLAFLKEMKVSYIFVDSLEEALQKIHHLFGVQNLVLTGGAIINGAFHKEGLIDKISIVVAPYLEGNHSYKSYAELNEFVNYKYVFKKCLLLEDGGVHLIFSRKD